MRPQLVRVEGKGEEFPTKKSSLLLGQNHSLSLITVDGCNLGTVCVENPLLRLGIDDYQSTGVGVHLSENLKSGTETTFILI